MKGIEHGEVRDVIARAFDANEFDMFLYERLEFNRPDYVAPGPFRQVVDGVLRYAEMNGWDPILIAEVAAARPLKAEVQAVYRKYAQALVDDARRQQVDESRRKMMERYALGPSVTVQSGGVAQEPAAPATSAGLERTVKVHLPFLDVALWRQQLFKQEGRVCRVEVNGSPLGTGFLVGPDVVLTNYHVMERVIASPALAAGVRLRFDLRVLGNGLQSEGTLVGLAGADWLVDHSPYTAAEKQGRPDDVPPSPDELDHALLRLVRPFGSEPADPGNAEGEARGWVAVPNAPPAVAPGMPIFILQHPLAQPLKLAIDTQGVQVVNPGGTRVRYATNTESGSSGSPCFDENWGLVALHHYGDPAFKHPATYNQGIPIGAIRDRLRRVGKEEVLGGVSP
jgi:hypothetical protein